MQDMDADKEQRAGAQLTASQARSTVHSFVRQAASSNAGYRPRRDFPSRPKLFLDQSSSSLFSGLRSIPSDPIHALAIGLPAGAAIDHSAPRVLKNICM